MPLLAAIHQPQYLPWLGCFDKIDQADVFCFLDNVQFKKNEWQNRNRIKTAQGWQWITVPVKHRFPQMIKEVEINNTVNWKKKHLQALVTNYKKAPFFDRYFDLFEDTYSKEWTYLSELNIFIVEHLCSVLNLQAKRVPASTLLLREDPTDRLIDICKTLGADTYLAGKDGAKYMDVERFRKEGIKVLFQDFHHPQYPQLFEGFQSHLSIIDLLFNVGPEAMKRLRSCNRSRNGAGS